MDVLAPLDRNVVVSFFFPPYLDTALGGVFEVVTFVEVATLYYIHRCRRAEDWKSGWRPALCSDVRRSPPCALAVPSEGGEIGMALNTHPAQERRWSMS